MGPFREEKAADKPFKKAYVAVLLWFVGRSIQAAAAVDSAVRRECDSLPEEFSFSLGVLPSGPWMVVGKDARGRVRYLGSRPEGKRLGLQMKIKSVEAAFLLFTFQEGTAVATARNRLVVDGDVSAACAVVRILDAVEVYLLCKPLARLAVKRYPDWPLGRKLAGRARIYLRAVLGR